MTDDTGTDGASSGDLSNADASTEAVVTSASPRPSALDLARRHAPTIAAAATIAVAAIVFVAVCGPAWWNDRLAGWGGWGGGVAAVALGLCAAVLIAPWAALANRGRPDARERWLDRARSTGGALGAAALSGLVVGTLAEAAPSHWLAWSIVATTGLCAIAAIVPVAGAAVVDADDEPADAWMDRVRAHVSAAGVAMPRLTWIAGADAPRWTGLGPRATLRLPRSLEWQAPESAGRIVVQAVEHRARGDRVLVWTAAAGTRAVGLALAAIAVGPLLGERTASPVGIVLAVCFVQSVWGGCAGGLWRRFDRRRHRSGDAPILGVADVLDEHAALALDVSALLRDRPPQAPTTMPAS